MRHRAIFPARALLWLPLAVVAGCSAPTEGEGAALLAVVGERRVTREDWEAYLAHNLPAGAMSASGDAILSRLFDALLEEELWLAEADRLGIEIGESEVERMLHAAAEGASDPETRRWILRQARIERVRQALLGEIPSVREDDARAYARQHLPRLVPPGRCLVRTLGFASRREATEVRQEILERALSLEQAVEIFGARPEESQRVELSLDDATEEVRAAIEDLGAGQVSRPVSYRNRVYLFLVEATSADVSPEHPWVLERAREALLEARLREAAEHLLQELRGALGVTIYAAALPFRYVPAGEGTAPAPTMSAASPVGRRLE